MKKITRALSMTLAAATALSTCVCAYADSTTATDENKQVLATVKSRVSVPEGLTKFSYSKSVNGPVNEYTYIWETPDDSDKEYDSFTVSAYGDIITRYEKGNYYSWSNSGSLAKMTGDQLYSAAVAAIKKLDPTISTLIRVDRDSINMSLTNNTVTFKFNRVKSGVPVTSDEGTITLDKNTGELYRFAMNWHPNASFKSKKNALTVKEAEKAYAEFINIKPVYVLKYDNAAKEYYTDIEYSQTDYGNIDAFTGAASDFIGDVWFDDNDITSDDEMDDADFDNGDIFTPEELAELEKKLPYGNAAAVEKYIRGNKYLTWEDDLTVSYDNLYKGNNANDTIYIYNVSFSNVPETGYDDKKVYTYVTVSIDAATGELYAYDYHTSQSDYSGASQYDAEKADKTADSILKSLSPKYYMILGDGVATVNEYGSGRFFGSEHQYTRTVNGIETDFDYASISLDKNMKLESYYINFTNIDFVSPDKMLTEQQVLDKFYEASPMKLNYLVKLGKKKTSSALVYSNNNTLRCNAFTGEPVYTWQYGTSAENDLSGITDPNVLSMAQALDDNGVIIGTEKFAQGDAVRFSDFDRMMDYISGYSRYYPTYNGNSDDAEDSLLTRGEAMKLFTQRAAGSTVAELKGIFKSPFSDVSDSDPNVGYYAIAYAMGAVKGGTFNASAAYTYGELITLVYDKLTK